MTDRPVILSQGMVEKALQDNAFYSVVPEFGQLRSAAVKLSADHSRGCSGCNRTRRTSSAFRNFTLIATSLTKEGQDRLKRYYGVKRIMVNTTDSSTQQITLKVI